MCARSDALQDFGGSWRAWWSDDATPVHHLRVTVAGVTIRNNLDGDSGDTRGNPSITPEGEWNMFLNVDGNWINLHDPRPGQADLMPQLGAVPSAVPTAQNLSTSAVAPVDLYLSDQDSIQLFSDARECDQPGYVDCPTKERVGRDGKVGRPVGRVAAGGAARRALDNRECASARVSCGN